MDALRITGGRPIAGTIAVSGSKNAALPMMAASILADEPVTLDGVPALGDVRTLAQVLSRLGLSVRREAGGALRLETVDSTPVRASAQLVRRMRAGFCVLGPLVARRGKAIVPLPGGCAIGDRPVDLHVRGLAALGADIRVRQGCVVATAERLIGAQIHLAGPSGPTVTGTANILCAATLARGRTVITGAATEPEVVDLGHFLISLGARIEGLGSSTIEIDGVNQLGGARYRVIPDRIEAATLLCAAAISGGSITVCGVIPQHMAAVLETISATGASLEVRAETISLRAAAAPRPVRVIARPHPHVPTDVQAQLTALAALTPGVSRIEDSVFPERFHHVAELVRLGADIRRTRSRAIVRGVPGLTGGTVRATDLRASAALVLAGLAADGVTTIRNIHHLDRGYERLDEKLNLLGAKIERVRPLQKRGLSVADRLSGVFA